LLRIVRPCGGNGEVVVLLLLLASRGGGWGRGERRLVVGLRVLLMRCCYVVRLSLSPAEEDGRASAAPCARTTATTAVGYGGQCAGREHLDTELVEIQRAASCRGSQKPPLGGTNA